MKTRILFIFLLFINGLNVITYSDNSSGAASLENQTDLNIEIVKNLFPNSKLPEYFGSNVNLARHYKKLYDKIPYQDIPLDDNPFINFDGKDVKIIIVPQEGDAVKNISDAIKAANEYTAKIPTNKAIIKLGSTEYHLKDCLNKSKNHYANKETRTCFYLSGLRNILFAGMHSDTMVVNDTRETGVFNVVNGEGIYFEGFAIDYMVLPNIQGIISKINVNKNVVSFELIVDGTDRYESEETLKKYNRIGGGR